MKTTVLKGSNRTEVGTKFAKVERLEQLVPCNMYGGAHHAHFTVSAKDLKPILFTPEFHVVELDLDGTMYKCIIKEVQAHPVTEQIQHVDFLELVDGKKVSMEIPVKLNGNPIGVKNGGKLIQKMRRIKVKTLPENLKGELSLNIDTLDVGAIIRISDVSLEGNEICHAPSIPILTISIPRAAKTAATTETPGKKK